MTGSQSSPTGRGQRMLKRAELQLVVPIPSAGMVRLGGNQVPAGDQFVAFA
jgi:hypothetical protein